MHYMEHERYFDQMLQECRAFGREWDLLSIHDQETLDAATEFIADIQSLSNETLPFWAGLRRVPVTAPFAWTDLSENDWEEGIYMQNLGSDDLVLIVSYNGTGLEFSGGNTGYSFTARAICGGPEESTTPSISLTRSFTASMTPTSSRSPRYDICNDYCVGTYGPCQSEINADFSCYPRQLDGACPPNTYECPDVVQQFATSVCNPCFQNMTGPCQHANEFDYECFPFDSDGVCPTATVYCEPQDDFFLEVDSSTYSRRNKESKNKNLQPLVL